MKILKKIINFLREVKIELKRINWPSKKETLKYALIIFVFSMFVAIYLWFLDYIFVFLLEKIIS